MIGVIDVGGTKLLAAVSEDGMSLDNVVRADTPADDPGTALRDLLGQAAAGNKLTSITMSVPGPFDRDAAALVNPPGMPPSWHGLNFRQTLGEHFSCPVIAENDANCSALAEAAVGAGRGLGTVLYFTVSTGVGTGVVREGRLQLGRGDTEGGHIVLWPRWLGGPACDCGGYGCLEMLASGRAIAARFGVAPSELDDQQAWDEIGRWLGLGVVNATTVIDPDIVIFGGGVTESWPRFEGTLRATVDEYLHLQPAPLINRAQLRDGRNNLLGALANLHGT